MKNECRNTVSAVIPFLCHNPVLELSAEIAALQTAVIHTRQDLKRGMKEKHILQEKISEEKLGDKAD